MRSVNPRNHGIAAVIAVILLGLVAVALVAMSLLFAAEMRRTGTYQSDAQLRQLLLAGGAMAREKVSGWSSSPPAGPVAMQIPAGLADSSALLIVVSNADHTMTVRVEARCGDRIGRQMLHFSQTGQVDQADLDAP